MTEDQSNPLAATNPLIMDSERTLARSAKCEGGHVGA